MKATLSPTQCRKMYRLQSTTSEAPHRNPRVRINNRKRHAERHHGLLQKVAHIFSQGIVGPMIHQCLQHVHAPIAWTLAGWWIRFRTQRQERRISRISETPQRWEARHTEPLRKQHCQHQSRTSTVAEIGLAWVKLARSRVISCCRNGASGSAVGCNVARGNACAGRLLRQRISRCNNGQVQGTTKRLREAQTTRLSWHRGCLQSSMQTPGGRGAMGISLEEAAPGVCRGSGGGGGPLLGSKPADGVGGGCPTWLEAYCTMPRRNVTYCTVLHTSGRKAGAAALKRLGSPRCSGGGDRPRWRSGGVGTEHGRLWCSSAKAESTRRPSGPGETERAATAESCACKIRSGTDGVRSRAVVKLPA